MQYDLNFNYIRNVAYIFAFSTEAKKVYDLYFDYIPVYDIFTRSLKSVEISRQADRKKPASFLHSFLVTLKVQDKPTNEILNEILIKHTPQDRLSKILENETREIINISKNLISHISILQEINGIVKENNIVLEKQLIFSLQKNNVSDIVNTIQKIYLNNYELEPLIINNLGKASFVISNIIEEAYLSKFRTVNFLKDINFPNYKNTDFYKEINLIQNHDKYKQYELDDEKMITRKSQNYIETIDKQGKIIQDNNITIAREISGAFKYQSLHYDNIYETINFTSLKQILEEISKTGTIIQDNTNFTTVREITTPFVHKEIYNDYIYETTIFKNLLHTLEIISKQGKIIQDNNVKLLSDSITNTNEYLNHIDYEYEARKFGNQTQTLTAHISTDIVKTSFVRKTLEKYMFELTKYKDIQTTTDHILVTQLRHKCIDDLALDIKFFLDNLLIETEDTDTNHFKLNTYSEMDFNVKIIKTVHVTQDNLGSLVIKPKYIDSEFNIQFNKLNYIEYDLDAPFSDYGHKYIEFNNDINLIKMYDYVEFNLNAKTIKLSLVEYNTNIKIEKLIYTEYELEANSIKYGSSNAENQIDIDRNYYKDTTSNIIEIKENKYNILSEAVSKLIIPPTKIVEMPNENFSIYKYKSIEFNDENFNVYKYKNAEFNDETSIIHKSMNTESLNRDIERFSISFFSMSNSDINNHKLYTSEIKQKLELDINKRKYLNTPITIVRRISPENIHVRGSEIKITPFILTTAILGETFNGRRLFFKTSDMDSKQFDDYDVNIGYYNAEIIVTKSKNVDNPTDEVTVYALDQADAEIDSIIHTLKNIVWDIDIKIHLPKNIIWDTDIQSYKIFQTDISELTIKDYSIKTAAASILDINTIDPVLTEIDPFIIKVHTLIPVDKTGKIFEEHDDSHMSYPALEIMLEQTVPIEASSTMIMKESPIFLEKPDFEVINRLISLEYPEYEVKIHKNIVLENIDFNIIINQLGLLDIATRPFEDYTGNDLLLADSDINIHKSLLSEYPDYEIKTHGDIILENIDFNIIINQPEFLDIARRTFEDYTDDELSLVNFDAKVHKSSFFTNLSHEIQILSDRIAFRDDYEIYTNKFIGLNDYLINVNNFNNFYTDITNIDITVKHITSIGTISKAFDDFIDSNLKTDWMTVTTHQPKTIHSENFEINLIFEKFTEYEYDTKIHTIKNMNMVAIPIYPIHSQHIELNDINVYKYNTIYIEKLSKLFDELNNEYNSSQSDMLILNSRINIEYDNKSVNTFDVKFITTDASIQRTIEFRVLEKIQKQFHNFDINPANSDRMPTNKIKFISTNILDSEINSLYKGEQQLIRINKLDTTHHKLIKLEKINKLFDDYKANLINVNLTAVEKSKQLHANLDEVLALKYSSKFTDLVIIPIIQHKTVNLEKFTKLFDDYNILETDITSNELKISKFFHMTTINPMLISQSKEKYSEVNYNEIKAFHSTLLSKYDKEFSVDELYEVSLDRMETTTSSIQSVSDVKILANKYNQRFFDTSEVLIDKYKLKFSNQVEIDTNKYNQKFVGQNNILFNKFKVTTLTKLEKMFDFNNEDYIMFSQDVLINNTISSDYTSGKEIEIQKINAMSLMNTVQLNTSIYKNVFINLDKINIKNYKLLSVNIVDLYVSLNKPNIVLEKLSKILDDYTNKNFSINWVTVMVHNQQTTNFNPFEIKIFFEQLTEYESEVKVHSIKNVNTAIPIYFIHGKYIELNRINTHKNSLIYVEKLSKLFDELDNEYVNNQTNIFILDSLNYTEYDNRSVTKFDIGSVTAETSIQKTIELGILEKIQKQFHNFDLDIMNTDRISVDRQKPVNIEPEINSMRINAHKLVNIGRIDNTHYKLIKVEKVSKPFDDYDIISTNLNFLDSKRYKMLHGNLDRVLMSRYSLKLADLTTISLRHKSIGVEKNKKPFDDYDMSATNRESFEIKVSKLPHASIKLNEILLKLGEKVEAKYYESRIFNQILLVKNTKEFSVDELQETILTSQDIIIPSNHFVNTAQMLINKYNSKFSNIVGIPVNKYQPKFSDNIKVAINRHDVKFIGQSNILFNKFKLTTLTKSEKIFDFIGEDYITFSQDILIRDKIQNFVNGDYTTFNVYEIQKINAMSLTDITQLNIFINKNNSANLKQIDIKDYRFSCIGISLDILQKKPIITTLEKLAKLFDDYDIESVDYPEKIIGYVIKDKFVELQNDILKINAFKTLPILPLNSYINTQKKWTHSPIVNIDLYSNINVTTGLSEAQFIKIINVDAPISLIDRHKFKSISSVITEVDYYNINFIPTVTTNIYTITPNWVTSSDNINRFKTVTLLTKQNKEFDDYDFNNVITQTNIENENKLISVTPGKFEANIITIKSTSIEDFEAKIENQINSKLITKHEIDNYKGNLINIKPIETYIQKPTQDSNMIEKVKKEFDSIDEKTTSNSSFEAMYGHDKKPNKHLEYDLLEIMNNSPSNSQSGTQLEQVYLEVVTQSQHIYFENNFFEILNDLSKTYVKLGIDRINDLTDSNFDLVALMKDEVNDIIDDIFDLLTPLADEIKDIPIDLINVESDKIKDITLDFVDERKDEISERSLDLVDTSIDEINDINIDFVGDKEDEIKEMGNNFVDESIDEINDINIDFVDDKKDEIKNVTGDFVNEISDEITELTQDFVDDKKDEIKEITEDFVNDKEDEIKNITGDFVNETLDEIKNIDFDFVNEKPDEINDIDIDFVSEKSDEIKDVTDGIMNWINMKIEILIHRIRKLQETDDEISDIPIDFTSRDKVEILQHKVKSSLEEGIDEIEDNDIDFLSRSALESWRFKIKNSLEDFNDEIEEQDINMTSGGKSEVIIHSSKKALEDANDEIEETGLDMVSGGKNEINIHSPKKPLEDFEDEIEEQEPNMVNTGTQEITIHSPKKDIEDSEDEMEEMNSDFISLSKLEVNLFTARNKILEEVSDEIDDKNLEMVTKEKMELIAHVPKTSLEQKPSEIIIHNTDGAEPGKRGFDYKLLDWWSQDWIFMTECKTPLGKLIELREKAIDDFKNFMQRVAEYSDSIEGDALDDMVYKWSRNTDYNSDYVNEIEVFYEIFHRKVSSNHIYYKGQLDMITKIIIKNYKELYIDLFKRHHFDLVNPHEEVKIHLRAMLHFYMFLEQLIESNKGYLTITTVPEGIDLIKKILRNWIESETSYFEPTEEELEKLSPWMIKRLRENLPKDYEHMVRWFEWYCKEEEFVHGHNFEKTGYVALCNIRDKMISYFNTHWGIRKTNYSDELAKFQQQVEEARKIYLERNDFDSARELTKAINRLRAVTKPAVLKDTSVVNKTRGMMHGRINRVTKKFHLGLGEISRSSLSGWQSINKHDKNKILDWTNQQGENHSNLKDSYNIDLHSLSTESAIYDIINIEKIEE